MTKKTPAILDLKKNDLVLLINEKRAGKFDEKYSGPFRVEDRISDAVSKIRKGKKSVIVHNDKLKRAHASYNNAPAELT